MSPVVRSTSISRRTLLGALVASIVAAGCKCKSSKPAVVEPPPVRPDDVLVEVVVRDPTTSWGRAKDMLGLLGLTLAKKPFTPFADSLSIPAGAEHSIEPSGPLVAVICDATPYPRPVLAWKVDDPEHLATLEPERFELKPARDGIRWWRRRLGDLPAARFPIGISDAFLVGGADEALVASHASYLMRGPGTALVDADVRFDVTARGARTPYVDEGLDRFDALAKDFADANPDAPKELAEVTPHLSELARGMRDWAGSGKPMRIELTMRKDAVTITAKPLDPPAAPATSAVIPGVVLRWLARTHALKALKP